MAMIRTGATAGRGSQRGSGTDADPELEDAVAAVGASDVGPDPGEEDPTGAEPGSLRARLGGWVESDAVQRGITILILFNAVILGLQTSDRVNDEIGGLLNALDIAIIAVFVVEIAGKLVIYRGRFFRSGWNWFDFGVVAISLIPSSGSLQVLRTLRVLRVLRLLSQVGRLRLIVESLFRALPGMGWTSLLLALVFYVFAVMGTQMFGDEFPEYFGSIGASLLSLFQVMTLESWASGIARPVMETFDWAWLYFVPFIAIASFMVLNLFIAIIVSATESWHEADDEAKRRELLDELAEIKATLREIQARDGSSSGQ